MKVAVLLTGNIRTLDQCKSNILEKLGIFNPDYFVSTYNLMYQHRPYMITDLKNNLEFFDEVCLTDSEVKEKFLDFSPKGVQIHSEDFINQIYNIEMLKFKPEMKSDSSSHFLQFWKVREGLNLIKNHNVNYDVIIRTRCDLILKDLSKLDFSDIESKIILGYNIENASYSVLNDQLIITSPKNFDTIFDFINNEFYEYTNSKSNFSFPHGVLESSIETSGLILQKPSIVEGLLRADGILNMIG